MNVVYIQASYASEAQVKARQVVRENCSRLRDVTLHEMSLKQFADWYVDGADADEGRSFDLHLVESTRERLDEDLRNNYTGALMRHWEFWDRVLANDAMGAVFHAAYGMEIIVYICDPADPTKRIQSWIDSSGRLTLRTSIEISDLDFLRGCAYRVESGMRALPLWRASDISDSPRHPRHVSPYEVDVIADAFGDEGLAWILYDLIGGDFENRTDAATTLGLTIRYCRRILTQQIEGVPLRYQCAIVPRGWWEKNDESYTAVLKFSQPHPRISPRSATQLDQLTHFSDGTSSLFVIDEDGDIRALVDLETAIVHTRTRMNSLCEKFAGIIVSTDDRQHIWVHSQRKASPLILSDDRWQLDPIHEPLGTVGDAMQARKWPGPAIDSLLAVVAIISDQRIGGFLIICENLNELQDKLKAAQLRKDISPHFALPIAVDSVSVPSLVRALNLDGAHIFDNQGRICSLCQMLSPPALGPDVGRGGTKHTTARRAAKAIPSAVVIAISHDGPVTVYVDGTVTTSSGSRRY